MKCIVLQVFLFTSLLVAQETNSAPQETKDRGQVIGHVTLDDTGKPGRFLIVQLVTDSLPEDNPLKELFDNIEQGEDEAPGRAIPPELAGAMSFLMKGSTLSTMTDIDGAFTVDQVPPGVYYVIAQAEGYLNPLDRFSLQERLKTSSQLIDAIHRNATKVVIQGNAPARVDIQLQRGSSLSGVVTYEDGSPVIAGVISVLQKHPDGQWKEFNASPMKSRITDDRGHYRVSGLPSGKYAIRAVLPTTQGSLGAGNQPLAMHLNTADALEVFSGNVFLRKDIQPIELAQGEEQDGEDLVFPLSKLHNIEGEVRAKKDHHAINSGIVSLFDSEGKNLIRTTMLNSNGGFRFHNIPEGDYQIKASDIADADLSVTEEGSPFEAMLNRRPLKLYASTNQPLKVMQDIGNLILLTSEQETNPLGKANTSSAQKE